MKIEHKVIRRDPFVTPNGKVLSADPSWSAADEEAFLDDEAARGWELVSVAMTSGRGSGGAEIRYFFRRRVAEGAFR